MGREKAVLGEMGQKRALGAVPHLWLLPLQGLQGQQSPHAAAAPLGGLPAIEGLQEERKGGGMGRRWGFKGGVCAFKTAGL